MINRLKNLPAAISRLGYQALQTLVGPTPTTISAGTPLSTTRKIRRVIAMSIITLQLVETLLQPYSYLPEPLEGVKQFIHQVNLLNRLEQLKKGVEPVMACEEGCVGKNKCTDHAMCPNEQDWVQGYYCDCSERDNPKPKDENLESGGCDNTPAGGKATNHIDGCTYTCRGGNKWKLDSCPDGSVSVYDETKGETDGKAQEERLKAEEDANTVKLEDPDSAGDRTWNNCKMQGKTDDQCQQEAATAYQKAKDDISRALIEGHYVDAVRKDDNGNTIKTGTKNKKGKTTGEEDLVTARIRSDADLESLSGAINAGNNAGEEYLKDKDVNNLTPEQIAELERIRQKAAEEALIQEGLIGGGGGLDVPDPLDAQDGASCGQKGGNWCASCGMCMPNGSPLPGGCSGYCSYQNDPQAYVDQLIAQEEARTAASSLETDCSTNPNATCAGGLTCGQSSTDALPEASGNSTVNYACTVVCEANGQYRTILPCSPQSVQTGDQKYTFNNCGDGLCQSGESNKFCPADCKSVAGNGTAQTSTGEKTREIEFISPGQIIFEQTVTQNFRDVTNGKINEAKALGVINTLAQEKGFDVVIDSLDDLFDLPKKDFEELWKEFSTILAYTPKSSSNSIANIYSTTTLIEYLLHDYSY
jgi:hypothetical protein